MGRVPTETLNIEIDRSRLIVTRSAALRSLVQSVERIAPADVPVLVSGETGTGKELIARLIHKRSPRADREFLAVDCNAVAPTLLESELFGHERGAFTGADQDRPGVFELADGGTLFLDEIANLGLPAQAKLLRVLQEHEVRRLGGRRVIRTDFRLITATNADVAALVRAGTFRQDLLHRLNVVYLHLPPLRERREDIPLLAGYFVNAKRGRLQRDAVCRISNLALDVLFAHDWPGNVRELEHVIERAMLECSGETIEASHIILGPNPGVPPSLEEFTLPFSRARQLALARFERLYLITHLRHFQGSVTHLAQAARITTKHVRVLMRRHGIDRRQFGRRPRAAQR